jgi:hypothetical protein
MVDSRRWILALAVMTLFAGLASAQVTGQYQMTCSTNVSVTPLLRAEGYTELTGASARHLPRLDMYPARQTS